MTLPSHSATDLVIDTATKADKKTIKRFYKTHGFAASFMGYDSCYIIKQNDDEIIAAIIVSQLVKGNQQALLHGLYVSCKYRNEGLATKLLEHCIIKHKILVCFANNNLQELYQKVGFSMLQEKEVEQHLNTSLITRFNHYQQNQPFLRAFIQR
ncbi:GNAT family N-acetyltransferase [Thalassotalea sp. 1_MG-2023]|uniref:GNAT family N-acetyltransferase n=1 Tax=Thalassotalea sp. 1_MG-2023 TaxID=3062680 RepID=UPI0026E2CD80|nr:GNAT family N-acetyltransferase [Thalassotalea sp. 1_MG-2023]MDO6428711.1 GNAT family N-acetyltransferase [Thalassotalea sp. 1_MG-2023]